MDALLGSISYSQFREWQAYARIEPFGERRADLRMGQLCALVANVVTDDQKSYQPDDFMPEFYETDQEQTKKRQEKAKQMRSEFRQMFG